MKGPSKPLELRGLLRHGLGFLVSGGLAFITDALVLEFLTASVGLDPIVARPRLDLGGHGRGLALASSPDVRHVHGTEPRRIRAVRGRRLVSAGFNYAVFVAIMLIWPETLPLVALVIASLAAMVVSYIGMRFGAFRVHGAPRF